MIATNADGAVAKLQEFNPRKKWYRRWVSQSAVALVLRQQAGGLETLMIKRAESEGDPWSGHMAFPGGRAELSDNDILHTARRETFEEIGLDTEAHTRYVGPLSDLLSPPRRGRKPMVITPHIFLADELPQLTINYEVAEVVWVPLKLFAEEKNREQMRYEATLRSRILPCYYYEGRCIWGLSLRMLDELISAIKN